MLETKEAALAVVPGFAMGMYVAHGLLHPGNRCEPVRRHVIARLPICGSRFVRRLGDQNRETRPGGGTACARASLLNSSANRFCR
jgi:hypothetical protein